MSSSPRHLVLFDIDGTLIQSGRAGLRGLTATFQRLYGRPDALDDVTMAGRTDRAIVSDVLSRLGLDPDEPLVHRIREAYLEDLRLEILKPVPDPSGVLPGVEHLLGALESRHDVVVGLLTGNFEGGAAIKLRHFQLWERFRFGAFGDHHLDRRDLMAVAMARARQAGVPELAPHQLIVIGDTPLDVDCAHAYGARAIAVATGPFAADVLASAGAEIVLDTLESAVDVDAWLSRPERSRGA